MTYFVPSRLKCDAYVFEGWVAIKRDTGLLIRALVGLRCSLLGPSFKGQGFTLAVHLPPYAGSCLPNAAQII